MNSNDEKLSRRIKKMTPLDDIMMSRIFDDNVPLIQYVIRTILHRDDIDIVSVRTQYELHNPVLNGKDIRLDILAVDSKGNQYNIEMQKYKSGASIRRAEIHAGALSLRGYSKGSVGLKACMKQAVSFPKCLKPFSISISAGATRGMLPTN